MGSYFDCENFKAISVKPIDSQFNIPINVISDFKRSKAVPLTDTIQAVPSILEQFSNELFFDIFNYLDVHHLYKAFRGLNSRFNSLLESCYNLSLTFDETTDQILMKSYAPYIVKLVIDTRMNCDFGQFPSLKTLVLCDRNIEHLKQIQPKILPHLTHLSFLLGSEFTVPSQLVNNIFSDKFPSLRHVNLSQIDESITSSWSIAPSLQFVSIRVSSSRIVEDILITCPNLDHLQLHILDENQQQSNEPPSYTYSLRRLTLWSHSVKLSFDEINAFLCYIPGIQHLYLQTEYEEPVFDLVMCLINRLKNLSRFDCYIKELVTSSNRTDKLFAVKQRHPCFNRIECIIENDNYRIFATD